MEAVDIFEESPEQPKDESLFPGNYGHTAEQESTCDAAADLAEKQLIEPAAKILKKAIAEAWEDMENYISGQMTNDVAYNFRRMVDDKTRYIIKGLLEGGYNEAEAKRWLYDFDFIEFRHKAYMANRETFENLVIEDLRKECDKLKKDLEFFRKRYLGE